MNGRNQPLVALAVACSACASVDRQGVEIGIRESGASLVPALTLAAARLCELSSTAAIVGPTIPEVAGVIAALAPCKVETIDAPKASAYWVIERPLRRGRSPSAASPAAPPSPGRAAVGRVVTPREFLPGSLSLVIGAKTFKLSRKGAYVVHVAGYWCKACFSDQELKELHALADASREAGGTLVTVLIGQAETKDELSANLDAMHPGWRLRLPSPIFLGEHFAKVFTGPIEETSPAYFVVVSDQVVADGVGVLNSASRQHLISALKGATP